MKQISFYYFLIPILVLLILKPLNCFADGIAGSYVLTGLAISSKSDTLKNQIILKHFKDKVDTIQTDSNGNYKTKIAYATACSSGETRRHTRKATNRNNPEFIFFTFKDIKIKIINDWRSYVSADYYNPESPTKRENLIF